MNILILWFKLSLLSFKMSSLKWTSGYKDLSLSDSEGSEESNCFIINTEKPTPRKHDLTKLILILEVSWNSPPGNLA